MCDCSSSHYFIVILSVVMSLVEFYLGRTDKITAGSTLELIYDILSSIIKKYKQGE